MYKIWSLKPAAATVLFSEFESTFFLSFAGSKTSDEFEIDLESKSMWILRNTVDSKKVPKSTVFLRVVRVERIIFYLDFKADILETP